MDHVQAKKNREEEGQGIVDGGVGKAIAFDGRADEDVVVDDEANRGIVTDGGADRDVKEVVAIGRLEG